MGGRRALLLHPTSPLCSLPPTAAAACSRPSTVPACLASAGVASSDASASMQTPARSATPPARRSPWRRRFKRSSICRCRPRRPPLSQIPNLLADAQTDPFDAPAARRRRTTVAGGRHEVLRTKVGAGGEEGGVGLLACLATLLDGHAAALRPTPLAPRRGSARWATAAPRSSCWPTSSTCRRSSRTARRHSCWWAGGTRGIPARASPATASFRAARAQAVRRGEVPPPKGAVGSGVALRIALDESARAAFAAAASPESGRLSGFDTISFDEFVEALAGCAEVVCRRAPDELAQRLEGTVHELLGAADVARVVAAANKANEPSRHAFMNCPRLPSENLRRGRGRALAEHRSQRAPRVPAVGRARAPSAPRELGRAPLDDVLLCEAGRRRRRRRRLAFDR